MKSADIPVGTHVCYDRAGSTRYPNYVEAFVITTRPKGNKYSSWGYRTGNHDTIGIAYREYGPRAEPSRWGFTWCRPQSIHMLWADYQATQDRIAKSEAEQKSSAAKRRKQEAAVWANLPQTVKDAVKLSTWAESEMLEKGEYTHYRISAPRIQAIVEAALKHAARNDVATVQAEVDAALALL